jgi:hypothetical protein
MRGQLNLDATANCKANTSHDANARYDQNNLFPKVLVTQHQFQSQGMYKHIVHDDLI